MAKKQLDEDDDFENDFENENENDFQDDDLDDESSDEENELLSIDDDSDIDIIIEIDEEDLDLSDDKTEKVEDDSDSGEEIILSKHKIEGKHSLKYDSIFKGKKEDPVSEDELDGFSAYYKETIEVDKSSIYHHESIDNESYIRGKLIKERVYEVLK
jgi:hypothetical protein